MLWVKFSVSAVIAFVTISNLTAQQSREADANPPPAWVQAVQDARQNQKDALDRMNSEQRRVGRNERIIYRNDPAKTEEEREILEDTKQKLAVPSDYYNKFAEFLKSKKYGIARLFLDKGCGQGLVTNIQELERCADVPQIKGGGSLFSFRFGKISDFLSLKSISYILEQSDIHFVENKFVVGNETTQDLISNIGELNLENLDLKSDAFKFLIDFKPRRTKSEFSAQKSELDAGINENGFLYSTSAPVKLNNTYALRTIAYYKKRHDYRWNKDLLIAFKVVGQEQDGSIIILWKKLKEKGGILFKGK